MLTCYRGATSKNTKLILLHNTQYYLSIKLVIKHILKAKVRHIDICRSLTPFFKSKYHK